MALVPTSVALKVKLTVFIRGIPQLRSVLTASRSFAAAGVFSDPPSLCNGFSVSRPWVPNQRWTRKLTPNSCPVYQLESKETRRTENIADTVQGIGLRPDTVSTCLNYIYAG